MAKKDLVKKAEALGVKDAASFKVAELEDIISAAEASAQTVAAPEDTPTATPVAGGGPHAAHAYGTSQGVHLQLGHMEHNADGNAEFHLASEFVLGRDAALALADELPGAAADHNAVGSHFG